VKMCKELENFRPFFSTLLQVTLKKAPRFFPTFLMVIWLKRLKIVRTLSRYRVRTCSSSSSRDLTIYIVLGDKIERREGIKDLSRNDLDFEPSNERKKNQRKKRTGSWRLLKQERLSPAFITGCYTRTGLSTKPSAKSLRG